MPVVSMCAWVSTFFCCCCRGNFEYCSLTVKRVIHPLVDLPSVLALKTNNLSLDWVYSCLDSGRKTGRLKKNQASCCSCINFFFALSAQVLRAMCPLWQSSGSDIVTHTHMKNRRKRRGGGGMEKEDECVSFKRMKGGKKDVLVMWISYKRTSKIQRTQQCRHPSQLPASHRFVFKRFYLKKNFKTDQQCSDFKEKSRSNLVSVVYVTKAKKKKIQRQPTMTWSLCVHVGNFFLCVCVVLTHTTEHTES